MLELVSWLMRLAAFGLIVLATTAEAGRIKDSKPRRCCAPDQWEADVKNMGTSSRTRDPDGNLSGKMAYDYKNRRWAFEYKDSTNRKSYKRIVFDHKEDSKFVVTSNACYNATLNLPKMEKYCVPSNASYNGRYDYGLDRQTVAYDIWTYDYPLIPIRVVLRMSSVGCIPLQLAGETLTRSHWWWKVGEPMCVPWQFPEQSFNGECFRSHVAHKVESVGARPSAILYNMDFRNINTTITDDKIFKIPAKCEVVDQWPADIQSTEFWSLLIMRMKLN